MNPLSMGIACAMLQPALRSLLIFDAPFTGLQQVARQIVEIALQTTGQKLRPIVMSSNECDDDLWGESVLPGSDGKTETRAQIFSPSHRPEETLLIIIPDLSALSLAAARASIMLVGANVANLERHGQHGIWSPRYYWLAGCQQEVVGAVSPHLLDRFALRLSWMSAENLALSRQERVRVLQRNMQQEQAETLPQFDSTFVQHVKRAIQYPTHIDITAEAAELILAYQEGEVFHQRRELALARCSLAFAQLVGDVQLLESHIEQAANLMGLEKQRITRDMENSSDTEELQPPVKSSEESKKAAPIAQAQTNSGTQPEEDKKNIEVQTQEPSEQQTIDYVMATVNPYPEDTEPVLREAASLQVPHRRSVDARSDRGPIIGVEPSTTLRDLALMSTLMRALLFQAFRPKRNSTDIVLDWTDLRKYRRTAEPERLLLLLLDYTSLSLSQRQHALVPYLSQAYIERAGIVIIKVGAATGGTKSNLRAESVSARSILVPIISEAIDAPVGNATPLAHGLDLALQTMRKTLQHGRSAVQHITFVVVSDGRGNVPLQASHSNTIAPPVAREGIEDALDKAQEIGKINHVNAVVLSPRLRYYQDLPLRLANALNANFITVEDEEDRQV